MENRYLSRGKRIDNGEWVIGNRIDSPDGRVAITETSGQWKLYKCIPGTICQCTAMHDKNKKLVFEHDIVWDSDERAFYEIIWNQEDMCWNVEDADGRKSEFEECYGSTIEVNGNRFDNPELLEE